MRIGFYSPYLHVLGGGERYLLSMASALSKKNKVDVFTLKSDKKQAEQFLGIDLNNVDFHPWERTLLKRTLLTARYDCFFYVTDGSLFVTLAKKNFLIVQTPQRSMYIWDISNQFKLHFWQNVLVYSNYVKSHIDKWWHLDALVFPPAINCKDFIVRPKENLILSVGRFFPLPHSKKQEILVKAFKELEKQDMKNWKLVLAGGVDQDGEEYFKNIVKLAQGSNIEIIPNISRPKLLELYSRAKIYWHGAGYGENLETNPERAEHFGITTIEAMASGCVPMVYPAGGQKEIIINKINGLYWNTVSDLVKSSKNIIKNNKLYERMSLQAILSAREYDNSIFEKKLDELIK